ncbi:hypothetical protein FHG68_00910 [Leptospira weilii]|nr:hypothetical protein FHG67_00900 [Leptospira weilii]QDK28592.1 hypothetical protein FHG68_00910 [Leptospira weilii]
MSGRFCKSTASGSQKLSQIGKTRLFRGRFQYSNFRNKFVIVFYSCVRVVCYDHRKQHFHLRN